jgi:type II secretory pathway pseudopilin PulG
MRHGEPSRSQDGFTYLVVLVAIALMSVGLVAASEVWVTTANRERSEQLEWIGAQYVQAIGSYYESSPGSVKSFPKDLSALLEDRRFLTTKRHLRQLYPNPFSGERDWDLLHHPSGGVVGIRAQFRSIAGHTALREFRYQPMSH